MLFFFLTGDISDAKVLETVDRSQEDKIRNEWGLEQMDEVVILLTPKK